MSIPAAYLGVILIWSTTPLAIQWSGVGADFMFPLLVRMVIGLVVCTVLVHTLRIPMPRSRAALNAYVAAGSGIFGAMLLVYWGARYVPSGLIAVLFGLIPLFTGLIGIVINDAERLTPAKLAGTVLGLAGLIVIFGAGAKISAQALPGIAAILGAVAIQAASLVWVKRTGVALPVLALTTGALTLVVGLLLRAVADTVRTCAAVERARRAVHTLSGDFWLGGGIHPVFLRHQTFASRPGRTDYADYAGERAAAWAGAQWRTPRF